MLHTMTVLLPPESVKGTRSPTYRDQVLYPSTLIKGVNLRGLVGSGGLRRAALSHHVFGIAPCFDTRHGHPQRWTRCRERFLFSSRTDSYRTDRFATPKAVARGLYS